jgi:peroxiredoxin
MKTGWAVMTAAGLMLVAGAVAAAAPDIPMRAVDGKTRNVSEFIGHGKWTVVVAWAHDCQVCAREIHEMTAFHDAHKDKDAIVLGVSVDGYDKVREAKGFIARHKLPFTNLIAEPKQEVMTKFGAGRFVGTPTYYVFNPEGEIVGQNIGPVTRAEVETFMAEPDQPVDADQRPTAAE